MPQPTRSASNGATLDFKLPRNDEAPDTYAAGRRCSSCGHTLSRYNPHDECWHHNRVGEPVTLERLMTAA